MSEAHLLSPMRREEMVRIKPFTITERYRLLHRHADAVDEMLAAILADIEALHRSQVLTPPPTALELVNIARARAYLFPSPTEPERSDADDNRR